ncbi:hypothetical protein HMPREF9419_0122 [Prevotella nigrescens ATCC 33563]|nr:hypothetical protein HMPREF9419_0122 [Prevotella nigrescens ATCC 33563]
MPKYSHLFSIKLYLQIQGRFLFTAFSKNKKIVPPINFYKTKTLEDRN